MAPTSGSSYIGYKHWSLFWDAWPSDSLCGLCDYAGGARSAQDWFRAASNRIHATGQCALEPKVWTKQRGLRYNLLPSLRELGPVCIRRSFVFRVL